MVKNGEGEGWGRAYHKDMFAVKLFSVLHALGTDLGCLPEVLSHVVGRELRQRLHCGIVPSERGWEGE